MGTPEDQLEYHTD